MKNLFVTKDSESDIEEELDQSAREPKEEESVEESSEQAEKAEKYVKKSQDLFVKNEEAEKIKCLRKGPKTGLRMWRRPTIREWRLSVKLKKSWKTVRATISSLSASAGGPSANSYPITCQSKDWIDFLSESSG